MSELRWETVELGTSRSGAHSASRGGQQSLFDDVVDRHVGRGVYEGLEFLHVEARTLVNRIPNPGRFPFKYTINAYRGCSHSCVYCLAADTSILMADGSARSISDVQIGDEIVGTSRNGTYLKYTPSTVTNRRSSMRPAVRVELSDGSSVIASPEHRFLSNRGWKHVIGSEHGALQRPHLTARNRILGTGPIPRPPKRGPEYERGYLAGMIRGDGSIGTYDYPRWSRERPHDRSRFPTRPG